MTLHAVRCCMLPYQSVGPDCYRTQVLDVARNVSTAPRAIMLTISKCSQALKGTQDNDRYELFWPQRPEFVRVAARFGATIIPVAGVGCEENAAALMGADSLARAGAVLTGRPDPGENAAAPVTTRSARRGVSAAVDEDMLPPDDLRFKLYGPSRNLPLHRYYFLFGRPIRTEKAMAKDREEVAKVYSQAKRALEDGITYLLEQRENDPFRSPLRRLLWERRERRQAPAFEPPPDVKL